MKKLNSKGFTLVELLAVIIILAIVVGITIPAVLTTVNNTKKKALETAASSVADWVDRQYQVITTGLDTAGVATLDNSFKEVCGATGSTCTNGGGVDTTNAAFITAAGLKTTNVSNINIRINSSTGRSCVTVTANPSGDYQYSGASADPDTAQSGAC